MKYLILIALMLVLPGCVSAQRAQSSSNAQLCSDYHRSEALWGAPDMNVAREIHARGGMTDAWLASLEAGERPAYTPGEQEFLTWGSGVGSVTTTYTTSGSVTVRRDLGTVSGGIPVRTAR